MPKSMSFRVFCTRLRRLGFAAPTYCGTGHVKFQHPEGRVVVVRAHKGKYKDVAAHAVRDLRRLENELA